MGVAALQGRSGKRGGEVDLLAERRERGLDGVEDVHQVVEGRQGEAAPHQRVPEEGYALRLAAGHLHRQEEKRKGEALFLRPGAVEERHQAVHRPPERQEEADPHQPGCHQRCQGTSPFGEPS